MKKNSIWEEYLSSKYEKLNENIECDVLIVGGGLAGILTAFYLKDNIKKLNIECDFLENDSYLYTDKNKNIKKIQKIESILKKLKIFIKKENIPINKLKSVYSIKTNLSYEINPIKYLDKIINVLNNVNIYESINGYLKGLKYLKNPTCPHLKCKLIYNNIENTWDCPCHGSRFDISGKFIFGPSKKV